MTAEEIIDGCGGTSAVASGLNPPRTPSTVSSWKAANFIPEWWQPAVLALASTVGFAMTEADFPTKADRRSNSEASAAA